MNCEWHQKKTINFIKVIIIFSSNHTARIFPLQKDSCLNKRGWEWGGWEVFYVASTRLLIKIHTPNEFLAPLLVNMIT